MKVFAIIGSRNHTGQTAVATDALLQGATDNGAQVERVFLPEKKIERCRQCDEKGWGLCRTQGDCAIKDDLEDITAQMKAADAIVFSTPVYFGDLSESMRAYTDRLRRTLRHERRTKDFEGKPAIGICVAGGGGGGAPNCTVSLEKVLRTCGFDLLDVVPVRRQNLEMKREVLTITGRWLTTQPPKA